jgi:hypothetical protein
MKPKLIIFDDFINLTKKEFKKINPFLISGRKYGFTVWLMAQEYTSIVMVAAVSTANNAALVAPGVGAVNLLSIKSNFMHLIHQADLQINGKTIESTQPYINVVKHFQMLSEMSVNDLATIGYTKGFGESVDNYRSTVFNNAAAVAASCSGNGFTNNNVVAPNGSRIGSTITSVQNSTAINDAITSKLGRYVDLTNPTGNKLVANIYTQANLGQN